MLSKAFQCALAEYRAKPSLMTTATTRHPTVNASFLLGWSEGRSD